ncbi:DEDD exonuclease domain-containing protein [Tessaracoccus sp. OS52]|uniref:DEDD exonuclease domain-containing protein n=1 Tax=Tessaracoccus sp. OS52 TaxID=2886691 RepID=UPI001D11D8E9|nr:DEDD exonuclease domain-containing protein [Tessaracoccus sp. OS52]MCC2593424.1 DEDD exonuclease domain-containing protein [Tessaracoccus sp. OS52]
MQHQQLQQPSFEDLGTHLSQVTFCVVDLETTGGSKNSSITEIGAVKVLGGQIIGEFQSLVRPTGPIPAMIQVLTGITNQMVADAPTLAQVIGPFAEFSAGCVLVAHNAPFDVGFLQRAHQELGIPWKRPVVVDTVPLARQVLLQEEVRNCKLATLAAHFNATTVPNHRALSDARATVDVLHGLLERVGNLGVHTLEDLGELTSRVSPDRRAKRVWAKDAPEGPGVYWFVHEGPDADGKPRSEVLYVGKSNNLRSRVRSYFSAAEQRGRIHEMVRVATGVRFLRCSTHLEAEVRELRMISSHSPRYNRRSRNQTRLVWLKLTNEAFPRLSVVRRVGDDGTFWGPFPSREAAQEAAMAIHETYPLRQCTTRLSARKPSQACALAEMGRCLAPCELGSGAEGYAEVVDEVRNLWAADVRPVLRSVRQRLGRLVREERFEEAAEVTARVKAFYRTSVRHHRVRSVAACAQIIAAAPEGNRWAIHVIRYGKLAAATTADTAAVRATAEALPAAAETVLAPAGGIPAGSVEEAERVAAWLESDGVRLLSVDGEWSWPLHAGLEPEALTAELTGHRSAEVDMAFPPELADGDQEGRHRRRVRTGSRS